MVKVKLFSILAFSFLIIFCDNPEPVSQVSDGRGYIPYYQAALKAYGEKNYEDVYSNFKLAHESSNDHLGVKFNYAVGCILTDRIDLGLDLLEEIAVLGVDYGMANSEDLAKVKDNPRFMEIVQIVKDKTQPVLNSAIYFRLKEKDLLTEGMTYDPMSKSFFVASVHKRKIVKISEQGEVTDFTAQREDIWGMFDVGVDSERNILWATTVALEVVKDLKKEDNGKSSLLKYDLGSGELLARFDLADSGRTHNLNDMIVMKNGDVYVSNNTNHTVHKYDNASGEFSLYLEGNVIPSGVGMTKTDDEKFIFVASYREGVFKIRLSDKAITKIQVPKDITLYGVDGFYFYENSFIAIQNGMQPNRVAKYNLNKDISEVVSFEILEMKNPEWNEPTIGVIVEDDFYFLGNSQWSKFPFDYTLPDLDKLTEPFIMKVNLNNK